MFGEGGSKGMRIFQGVDSYLDQSEHSPRVGGDGWRRELPMCLYQPLVSGNIVHSAAASEVLCIRMVWFLF